MRTTDLRLWSRTLLVALVLVAGAGCGSDSSSPSATATDSVGFTSGPDEAVSPIVGRWSQLHSCPHLVHAFRAAGLGDLAALQAAAFGPDRPESEMPTPAQLRAKAATLERGGDLCAGAHAPYVHSHFFTADGQFGSLDEHLQQVDDGGYRVAGDMLVFGKNRFRFHVTGEDTLTLEPVITPAMRRQALAHPSDFTDATWMVSVAYAGSTWHRAPCRGWC